MRNKCIALMVAVLLAGTVGVAQQKSAVPQSPRLYIFDCGVIKGLGVDLFGFKQGEVPARDFFVPCYLIVHPKGTMMWDVGVIPDSAFKAGGAPATDGRSSVDKPLLPQLAALGYTPANIDYLALSHYHSDHTANANAFAGSTWLVHPADRDFMFGTPPPGTIIQTATFAALKTAKTKLLDAADYDVFGDGTVVIKYAPGHTPGHQVLFLKLEEIRPARRRRRPLSLPGGADDAPVSGLRIRQGAVGEKPRKPRRLHEEDKSHDVDRARCGVEREAEEGAGVLRMKIYLSLAAVALLVVGGSAQTKVPHFEVDPSFPQLPAGKVLGDVSSVAVDGLDNVFLIHRPNTVAAAQQRTPPAAGPRVRCVRQVPQREGRACRGLRMARTRARYLHIASWLRVGQRQQRIRGRRCRAASRRKSDDMLLKFGHDGRKIPAPDRPRRQEHRRRGHAERQAGRGHVSVARNE